MNHKHSVGCILSNTDTNFTLARPFRLMKTYCFKAIYVNQEGRCQLFILFLKFNIEFHI